MNKRIVLAGLCLLLFIAGCKDENQKFRDKLIVVITSYIEENIEGFQVDSVSILGIDSLTHLDYAYLRKITLKNHESEIFANELLYIESKTDEEREAQAKLQSFLRNIQSRIEECDNIMINPTTDTTTIHYFFVATSIYGKQDGKELQYDFGFPIDKEFNIQEIDIGE